MTCSTILRPLAGALLTFAACTSVLADDKPNTLTNAEIADGWLQKALDTNKIKAARAAKQPGGIHAEN